MQASCSSVVWMVAASCKADRGSLRLRRSDSALRLNGKMSTERHCGWKRMGCREAVELFS